MAAKAHPITADELLRMPDGDLRRELDEGGLIEMSPPGADHGRVAGRFYASLARAVGRRALGDVFIETGFVLRRKPDVVRGPDVSFVRAARLAGVDPSGFIEGAPDIAFEVSSPSERPAQLARKVRQYLRYGARAVIVADPRARELDLYRADAEDELLRPGDVLRLPDILPGWKLPVADLFPAPRKRR